MSRSDGYRLLIFDWDGTLLDSITSIVSCTQAALAELGHPPADEALIRGSIGLGLREMVNRFVPGCTDELYGQIVEAYRRLWFETYSKRPQKFPGTDEVLSELSGHGYLMAVATAKSRGGLNHDLEAMGLGSYFLTSRTETEARSKPDPQMILDIVDELGVPTSETLMIGDTTHDLLMALNADTDAVAVTTGSQGRQELEQASPLACFDDLRELPPWLRNDGG